MECISCSSSHIIKKGVRNDRQRYKCLDCGCWSVGEVEDAPVGRVLLFDIETSIRHAFLFGTGDQYIKADYFEDQPFMLGWSAKYAGDSKIYSSFLTPKEAIAKDQERIVKDLWDLMATVNIVSSFNGNNFDMKHMTGFFMKYRMGLPSKLRNIDPCQLARNTFRLDSNSMDYIVKYLGLDDGKEKMERQDWIDCYYGNPEKLKKMEKYCRHDVEILELVLDTMKPYVSSLPNMGVYGEIDTPVCPSCGGVEFKENGYQMTSFGKYNSYRCSCQALFRSRQNLLSLSKRKNIFAFK